ncbi:unknown protein [Microcystis aeruginosa NIES-843]|uniref:Uncharacterized protein n=1 Tax=Microcystis aeruginosa (strain NIES-843 / IAM M-2473) TaxID=449447 RepID=B0JM47_MICAN|nr:unknown protein [Microcystis aeruginosa NIES-843]
MEFRSNLRYPFLMTVESPLIATVGSTALKFVSGLILTTKVSAPLPKAVVRLTVAA